MVEPSTGNSHRLQAVLLVGALVLIFVGEFQIFRGEQNSLAGIGTGLLIIGTILFVRSVGIGIGRQPDSALDVSTDHVQPVRIRMLWLTISFGLAWYMAWRSVQLPSEAYLEEYALVSILTIITLAVAILPLHQRSTEPDKKPLVRWEYGVIGLLLIGAVAVRGIGLGTVPYMMDEDEANFASEGASLAYNYDFQGSPFQQGVFSYARAYPLLIGVSTVLLGKTLLAARLPSMIFGALTVPALYLLGRELFNRRVALVAALFMLGWAYHAHFSRLALNQAGDPLFTTLAFYFLLRGLRLQTVVNYFMAGLTLGIAQLFYLGGRLAPIVMVVYLLYLLIRQRSLIIKQWRLLAVVVLVGFIVTLPQNFWILYNHQPLTTRVNGKSIFVDNGPLFQHIQDGTTVQFAADQLRYSFSGLFSTRDSGGWYGPGSNLMGIIGAPIMLLGVIATVPVFWKRPRWILPFLWGLAVILGGSTLENTPPAYERYFPGVVAFSLLVAAGTWYIALGITHVFDQPQLAKRLMASFGVLILIGNLAFYMFDYIPARGYFNNPNNWHANRVVDEILPVDKTGCFLVLVGGFNQEVQITAVIRYYLAGERYAYVDADSSISSALATTAPNVFIDYRKPLCFFVSKTRGQDLGTIVTAFPGGIGYPVYLTQNYSLAFWVYKVDLKQTHF